jgi:hypothetical protein
MYIFQYNSVKTVNMTKEISELCEYRVYEQMNPSFFFTAFTFACLLER